MSTNTKLAEALRKLLARDLSNTCTHEETHRGGLIWEICDACGAKWADDEGGKPEWKDPPEWHEAEQALAAHDAEQAQQIDAIKRHAIEAGLIDDWGKELPFAVIFDRYGNEATGKRLERFWQLAHDAEQAALRELECPPDPETVERAIGPVLDDYGNAGEPGEFPQSDGQGAWKWTKLQAAPVEQAAEAVPAGCVPDFVLRNVLTTLKFLNEQPDGPIRDTLWHSEAETLFDYIENSMEEFAAPTPQENSEELKPLNGMSKEKALEWVRNLQSTTPPAPEAPKNEWRELALKFDGQRMAALSHLRMLLEHGEAHAGAVRKFLAEPPQAAPEAQQAEAEAFSEDQWWYAELDSLAKTPDQRRAMAVVRNLMRQFAAKAKPEAQPPSSGVSGAQQAAGQELPDLDENQFQGCMWQFAEHPPEGYESQQVYRVAFQCAKMAYSEGAHAALAQRREPLTERQRRALAGNYFSEQWAIQHAMHMLHDCEAAHGIGATTGEQR